MPPHTTCKITTDHDEIRRWTQERDGKPATVVDDEKAKGHGALGLKLPGRNGRQPLQETSWEGWLKKFEQRKLAFLYQEQMAGGARSNYHEIVSRQIADEVESAVGGKGRSASRRDSSRAAKPDVAAVARGVVTKVAANKTVANTTGANRQKFAIAGKAEPARSGVKPTAARTRSAGQRRVAGAKDSDKN